MSRFEIGEEVIIKERNITLYQGRVASVIEDVWGNNSCPLYRVTRMNGRSNYRFAVDNKDRCRYLRNFPPCRIYKLGEA